MQTRLSLCSNHTKWNKIISVVLPTSLAMVVFLAIIQKSHKMKFMRKSDILSEIVDFVARTASVAIARVCISLIYPHVEYNVLRN